MHFTCAARTDVGVVRSGNEDNYLMLSDRGVFIVADGMGGHAAGEVGEIELSGPQVAYGYLPENHPQNECFGWRGNRRVYRTGDFGIVDQDGSLTVSGRIDGQLKWNGNRVEIGEIERVAQDAAGVCQAVAVPITRDNRVIDVILFVQMREDDQYKRAALRNHLTGSLPGYMRPRSIRFIDRLPVTLHGKVDRKRLMSSCSENITL